MGEGDQQEKQEKGEKWFDHHSESAKYNLPVDKNFAGNHINGLNKKQDVASFSNDKSTTETTPCSDNRGDHAGVKSAEVQSFNLPLSLPSTTQGWTTLLAFLSSSLLGYELRLQKALTCPPLIFGQVSTGPLKDIFDLITEHGNSFLQRPIRPSLFVGTRALVSSSMGYIWGGPKKTQHHVRFRQILTMAADGAQVALDWELPVVTTSSLTFQQRKQEILQGPIQQPVVIICHGINNDSSFGYIGSLMRACTDRGWAAVGMNFRGCGKLPLRTPRAYNGAYTGDIRGVVQNIASRLANNVPLFLVGNSLGGNLVTKYLGEEGLGGPLPACVAGGVALGNPLRSDFSKIPFLTSSIMALGFKKSLLENWSTLRHMNDPAFRTAIRKALLAVSIAQIDEALAPIFIRNHTLYPYSVRIGFKDGADYWKNSSSYFYSRHVSVPMLQIIARDDFICHTSFQTRMQYLISNPNIMVVETKCGGHLGWQEARIGGANIGNLGTSWADTATTEFIAATLKQWNLDKEASTNYHGQSLQCVGSLDHVPLLLSRL